MTAGRKGLPGIGGQLKDQLIRQVMERRMRRAAGEAAAPMPAAGDLPRSVPEAYWKFAHHPGYQQLRIMREGGAKLGIANPYFRAHEGSAGGSTRIEGREFVNFSSYNYLGLSGDARVNRAAKRAIDRYGTSVSASRLVSGERPVHAELERALACAYGTEDCVAFVSGHATNVSTIGYLFGAKDLVLYDSLIHNSVLQGIQLSGAQQRSFAHNDPQALEEILARERPRFERVLIVLEGIYSMDGDYPDLPAFIEVKNRHRAFLMVDEAHSFGVLGAGGLGIREHFGIAGGAVDIWMGTLSKSLAGCGGYVAGERTLVENLKFAAPGFVYSVGMAPPLAASSLAALQCMLAEPERVRTLQARGRLFLELAKQARIDTGTSSGNAVVPAITGSSIKAARLSQALFERGINVQPILYPAVPDKGARLRFFLSCQHTEEQIRGTVKALAEELAAL
ncbi:MAG: aminotransferase class I/II-fold pyridoxal phosphate-dependent enzyme [Candidatus Parcubacteria bacterium]|nr:aminotransferase class I/II-fold pyridoxal phosphate-dependent enzyme [Burkholderiales bacterium]